MTLYFCCDDRRRSDVLTHPTLNGIDFLEVEDDIGQPLSDRQRFLNVVLLKPDTGGLTAANVRIDGGDVVRDIRIKGVTVSGKTVRVEVDRRGDFSPYTLRLVATSTSDGPPAGYDRLLSAVDFSFKANCDSEFDCEEQSVCPTEQFTEPSLSYLARDFNSLRTLMLNRMRTVAPHWREDHLADFMQAMIDLKAYVSDYQHYQLDAINTEAYLFTARSRISVRRHARLVDYYMHDGCSARVWTHVRIDPEVTEGVLLSVGTQLFTKVPGLSPTVEPNSQIYRAALETKPQVFETLHDVTLYSAHNEMCFYTWGDSRCVLPRGATRATLKGVYPNLKAGEVLIFEEVRGAITGDPADADPTRRFAVRLISVGLTDDTLYNQPVTELVWHSDDALPAPLCLSSNAPPSDEAKEWVCPQAITVARGNVVLAQHGLLAPIENLGKVPQNSLFYSRTDAGQRCDPLPSEAVPPRFRPKLELQSVAQHIPYDHVVTVSSPSSPRSAKATMQLDPAQALPAVVIGEDADFDAGTLKWLPLRDLLQANGDDRNFVTETDNDGTTRIRFGNDDNGRRPDAGTDFYARYYIGDPTSGNIGADAIAHLATNVSGIVEVRNPIPAQGGQPPESIEAVRQNAPQAFRRQERAVTPQDYETVALRYPGVQRAMATIRWTGSWYTVYLTVDRLGGASVNDLQFKEEFLSHMDRYRMMGYDLEVNDPHYVPIELRMMVCVHSDYFRADVNRALHEVFSARILRDGTKGVFHPDNFTFGQTVYLSRIYAAAATVSGVQSAQIITFQVQDQPTRNGLASGSIDLGRLEVAQMENDPNYPKRGIFILTAQGGK